MEKLVCNKFKEVNSGVDLRLNNCKIDVCILIYDLIKGNLSVFKIKYYLVFERDYYIFVY